MTSKFHLYDGSGSKRAEADIQKAILNLKRVAKKHKKHGALDTMSREAIVSEVNKELASSW